MTDNTPTTKQEEGGLLLPCPFCGSTADFRSGDDRYYVVCDNLACYAVVGEGWDAYCMPDHAYADQVAAADAWNTRAPATPPHNEDGLRKALEAFLMMLTDDGRNSDTMLTINHDQLRVCMNLARQALGDIPSG
jgi:hypothetical protein